MLTAEVLGGLAALLPLLNQRLPLLGARPALGVLASPAPELWTEAEAACVTAPTDVVGSVDGTDLAGWRLSYRSVDANELTTPAEGSSAVTSSALGEFDPTLMINGQYHIVLEAWNSAGALSSIVLTGEVRVGGPLPGRPR